MIRSYVVAAFTFIVLFVLQYWLTDSTLFQPARGTHEVLLMIVMIGIVLTISLMGAIGAYSITQMFIKEQMESKRNE